MFSRTDISIVKTMRCKNLRVINQTVIVASGIATTTDTTTFVSWPCEMPDGIYDLSTGVPIKTEYNIEDFPPCPSFDGGTGQAETWTRYQAETLVKHASNNVACPVLCGINTAKIATNFHVLVSFTPDSVPAAATIPATALKIAIKTREKTFKVQSGEQFSEIAAGKYTTMCRNIAGQYPATNKVIPAESDRPNTLALNTAHLKPYLKKDFRMLFTRRRTRIYTADDNKHVIDLPVMASGGGIMFNGEILAKTLYKQCGTVTYKYRGERESAVRKDKTETRLIMPCKIPDNIPDNMKSETKPEM